MQGIFIDGRRPKSKAEIKRRLLDDDGMTAVYIEGTSLFGNEYDGSVKGAPDGQYLFVGPDPHTKRNFYGKLIKRGDKVTVS